MNNKLTNYLRNNSFHLVYNLLTEILLKQLPSFNYVIMSF